MNPVSALCLAWIIVTVALYWAAPRSVRHYLVSPSTALFLLVLSPVSFVVLAIFTLLAYAPARYNRQSMAGGLSAAGAVAAVFVWFKSGISLGGPLG